jgi:cytochrome b
VRSENPARDVTTNFARKNKPGFLSLQGFTQEKIWDPVTRLWHWALVLSVGVGWSFGRFMSFDTIQWHFYLGYFTLGLMVFRCLWGVVGPRPVRFAALLPTPRNLLAYLRHVGRRGPSGTPGHNPMGSLSVILMLLAISAQAFTGLFIESDDFFEYGPLAGYVSEATVSRMTWWHHLNADFILALVVLHVSAILFYLIWKNENLIKPMITGWKWVKRDSDQQR